MRGARRAGRVAHVNPRRNVAGEVKFVMHTFCVHGCIGAYHGGYIFFFRFILFLHPLTPEKPCVRPRRTKRHNVRISDPERDE